MYAKTAYHDTQYMILSTAYNSLKYMLHVPCLHYSTKVFLSFPLFIDGNECERLTQLLFFFLHSEYFFYMILL